MRLLLLSDVHANARALDAVLTHARRRGWDEVAFLGDAVGYYPEPERAVELLAGLEPRWALLGNHDELLLKLAAGEDGSADARAGGVVLDVLRRQLDAVGPDALAFLRGLRPAALEEGWQAVHGALRSPWEYVDSLVKAQASAPFLIRPVCFIGHTHVPRAFAAAQGPQGEMWRTVPFRGERSTYRVPPRARAFLNPGSVGQPRDGIPLASYGIWDDAAATLEVHRVEFDLLGVQRAVRAAGYPEVLARRLEVGT